MSALARHWDIARAALADERARAKSLVKASEVTFLPAALEIIETPVSPTFRFTAYVLLMGVLVSVVWLVFGQIDVVASSPGRLIPAQNVKLVQPAEGGVVRNILVHDGQFVQKGQVLVELDPSISAAEAAQAEQALTSALLDAARARAVLSAVNGHGLSFVAPGGVSASLAATHAQLASAEFSEILAGSSMRTADRSAASAQEQEARIQAAKLSETLPLLDEQIAANETLLAKGYVSKLRVIEMRRQRLIAERERDASLKTAERAKAQILGAGGGMALSRAEAQTRVLTELAKAEADVELRRSELAKAIQRSSLQRLLSPVDGVVSQLSVHTIGGVVEAAKPLMVIVPRGGDLILETKIFNRDRGFVSAGQVVAIKLEAFPFTRFGTIPGRIESIGSDAVEDEKLGLTYPARIRLERSAINRGDAVVPLSPGMQATADIRTGKRSILSFLMSPIDTARMEAGRER